MHPKVAPQAPRSRHLSPASSFQKELNNFCDPNLLKIIVRDTSRMRSHYKYTHTACVSLAEHQLKDVNELGGAIVRDVFHFIRTTDA